MSKGFWIALAVVIIGFFVIRPDALLYAVGWVVMWIFRLGGYQN